MNNGVQLTDPTLLRYKAYIDGQWTSADSGKSFAVTDPATGAEVTWVPDLGVEETRRAVASLSSRSRLASLPRSRRGTSRWP